ncbi:TetR/AcrR family transcriptional regulator [Rugamonas apoptosis]|uniref:TetR/AcrR family transcriptional regulator n=1 Tax=Rugamonas apoptosis TaxID=2758570 RepID=A0A7W2FEY7_9BURK|nr:TetR/AcrR family transcriptional regulator [Rugamonas apoptosis]MBA5690470.1 TetR/AcrR family transcriptional regulator [Rugamonas apoptosis]
MQPVSRKRSSQSDLSNSAPAQPIQRRARKQLENAGHMAACAWQLFETLGYEATTMEAIAVAADVARATLYRYFPVKEALIAHRFHQDQITHQQVICAGAHASPDLPSALRYILQIEVGYAERMKPYMGPYLAYQLAGQQNSERIADNDIVYGLVLDLLRRALVDGNIDATLRAEQLAEYFAFLRLSSLMHWLARPNSSLLTLYEDMLGFFINGTRTK